MEPRRRWTAAALEVVVSFAAAGVFPLLCLRISIDPLDRVGQVSGVASLGLRFMVLALPVVAALVIAARVRGGAGFAMTSRFACAALAGITSGMVAGGVVLALHGTRYGLGSISGDAVTLSLWADTVRAGGSTPSAYPPLQIHLLAWLADVFDMSTLHALKPFQILGVVAMGPAAYLSWRLLLRPIWALAIGVTAALALIEPYRQYPFLTLLVFVPVAVRFLQLVRRAADHPALELVKYGIAFGLGLGVLCLNYSGWFVWSAPGFLFALLVVFPWRRPMRNRAALLCAVAGVMFAIVTFRYAQSVLAAPPIKDNFMYFDSSVEPAYIAMWRGDAPGPAMLLWPPFGELGGVGLFTIVLAVGLGLSVALGRARTLVIGVGSIMVGAWLLRFWNAHLMWKTKLVQLYPRTTAEILYCLLILTGFAGYFAFERAAEGSVVREPSATLGAICGLVLLYGSAGSAISDRYMPKASGIDIGYVAYYAQMTPEPDADQTKHARIKTSSSYEADGWSSQHLIDGDPRTGYTSQPAGYYGKVSDHEEWIELSFPTFRRFSKLVLYPAAHGFPVDFTFEVWDSLNWIPRVSKTGLTQPSGPQTYSWGTEDETERVRLRVTKLGAVGDDRQLQLNELELWR